MRPPLEALRTAITDIARFYPIQLPLFQLRRHLLLSAVWILLWLIALSKVGQGLGVSDIFYDPRTGLYPTWATCFAWGVAYGLFVVAYHLTTYLLDGHHAGFLLRERQPFLQYVLNNSLLPVTFWLFYLHHYTLRHASDPNLWVQLAGHAGGFLGLCTLLLGFLATTTQDIFQLRRLGLIPARQMYQQVRHAEVAGQAVRYYLAWPKGICPTQPIRETLEKKALAKILFQHHRNAFLLEVGILAGVSAWGYLQSVWEVYAPAGAAFLVLLAMVYLLVGAIKFWLRRWGGWAIVALIGLGVLVMRSSWLQGRSPAYGLSYQTGRPEERQVGDRLNYGAGSLSVSQVQADSLGLVACLQTWAAKQGGPAPLVWIQVSGGGWRSAFWTLSNLQYLDSLTRGQLWRRTFGISGASGGLIGAAHWRELGLFYPERRWDLTEAFLLTQDVLNPILSTGLLGLLSPSPYLRDSLTEKALPTGRGYAFEQALMRNARAFYRRRLNDYTTLEQESRCPLLFITPAMLPMGRQLLISSQPTSILARDALMVELRSLVSDADRLYLITALRMNAAFPFVLPPVSLPGRPGIEVIDAGAIDNFGELIAIRFLWELRAAIAQYASRVVVIEIRDLPLGSPPEREEKLSPLAELLRRLAGLYSSFAGARRLFTQLSYEILAQSYPIPVEKYVLALRPVQGQIPPLGFTLQPVQQAAMLGVLTDSLHQRQLEQIGLALE